ncbi:oligosaccharide flippase family protein [Vibrio sp. Vb2354]|uniref:lipopolysaccharide biosynthesis protein n=1 Tax=unclassified Vibrio TaxID=2614977 RepID=UPI00296528CB|nr:MULTISPECIES: oligosaccharide flippase family protein [unclassified Vibrio]MDW1737815.1 oligosaccharide flippase family protein [Vibrio sp. Vb2321]MDW1756929.1 oligosaccharide flippase family protein [Vibrio sp. Vb2353]MDW1771232.1 oligosaccharide flippase family protein [Vibrio sp. Vb2354]MDW1807556.1 oligosaccharide flippase family protein [Vibrio sp. Vb2362]
MSEDFTRHVLTLFSGTLVAQLLPIAITPILTRIYSPEEFGLMAVFLAITMTFGSVACGRYEIAILKPKKDSEAYQLASLCILVSTIFCLFLFLILSLFNIQVVESLKLKGIGLYLYFIPLVVWLMSIFNVFNYLCTRQKKYGVISKSKVLKSLALSISQIALGYTAVVSNGLLSGVIISHFFGNIKMLRSVKVTELLTFDYLKVKNLAKRYHDFPKYSLPAILANNLSNNLVTLVLPTIYGIATVGYYSLANRLLGLPTTLIGNSVGQVLYQKSVETIDKEGDLNELLKFAIKRLLFLSVVIFFPLYFIIEPLFVFIFGNGWEVAGKICKLLIPMYAFRLIGMSISLVNSACDKQKISLIWQVILLASNSVVVISSFFYEVDIILLVTQLSIINIVNYSVLIYLVFQVSKGKI